MIICIKPEELRAALADIERAEANGFHYCLSVFRLSSAGRILEQNLMEYSDIIEKAHPTNGNFNWGRHQGVTRDNKFVDGKLIPIKSQGG